MSAAYLESRTKCDSFPFASYLLVYELQARKTWIRDVLILALYVLMFLVATSRVYLEYHTPEQVSIGVVPVSCLRLCGSSSFLLTSQTFTASHSNSRFQKASSSFTSSKHA